MRTEEEFNSYYNNTLLPYLKEFDKKRKPLVRIRLANWALLLSILPISTIIVSLTYNAFGFLIALPIIGLMIWLGIKRYKQKKIFVAEYKENVIKEMVKIIEPGLQYNPADRISDSQFYNSQIYTTSADRSHGEDLIYGMIGQTKIEFSELHLEYKTESTDSNGNRQTHWHTIFKGVFFVADFNKHFKTETVVLPDGLERILGKFARKLQKITTRKGKLIQLENPEFEKYFKVFATDSIESRYVLSPSLMERMVQYRKKTGIKLAFSFVDSNIYMALPIMKNLFEPRIFKNNFDIKFIKESFDYLILFTGMVDELNLNTRIWSKQ
jgi:hypothetical protein